MVRRSNAVLIVVLLISLGAGFYLGWDLAKAYAVRPAFSDGEDDLPAPPVGGAAEPAPPEPVPLEPAPPEANVGEEERTVFLTFDDGPSKNTPLVLDILRENGIKATFFVNGRDNKFARQMYRRIVDEGHALGNHTYSHDYALIYSSVAGYLADTEKLNDLLSDAAGVRPNIIRFPGGSANHSSWAYGGKDFMAELTQRMTEEGYHYFDWNVVAGDAAPGVTPGPDIVAAVREGMAGRRQAIVLFHDGAKQTTTVEALPEIIRELREQGYGFAVLTPDGFTYRFGAS